MSESFPMTTYFTADAAFPAIVVNGVPRPLAMLPTPAGVMVAVPTWQDSGKPSVDPAEIVARNLQIDIRSLPIPPVDQGTHGSCTNGSCRGALQGARWKAGMPHVPLSGTWAYAHCKIGLDGGANIGDVFQFAATNGLCADATCPETCINAGSIDATKAAAEAKRFRWSEIYQGQGSADAISALACGYDVELGVCVGVAFNCDRTTLNVRVGLGPANHAIWACGLVIFGGTLYVLCRNSWGNDWPWQGAGGWFTLTPSQIDRTWAQEIWIGKAPTFDPQDPGGPVYV